ncbi:MAG: OmpA family protein [Myxococcales bacterium]|nr:OmpA family protein [Myxococcales bacterium]
MPLTVLAVLALPGCGQREAMTADEVVAHEWVDLNYDTNLADNCERYGLEAPRFRYDDAQVTEAATHQLRTLATCLSQPPLSEATVLLTGHTDPRGAERYNLDLGLARARHVQQVLVEHGVDPARIVVASAGERDADGRRAAFSHDRRVDIAAVSAVRGRAVTSRRAPATFDERADVDEDGVDEPDLYPRAETDQRREARPYPAQRDVDDDGADEPPGT